MTSLPQATTLRFQPLRSGLFNLFKYQEQEFWFEKGRLLVRGNNGTGKSRVLALQLPFLFDGEIASRRVEPDGDPARQMAWHLLMDDLHDQRTGYTWIEFGRRDEHGTERYLTLGCGMKAVKGGDNQPTRWYFITSKRIGADLALVDASTPRSAERLHEALGTDDFFTKTAKDYRAEVNRRLFGLSGNAYAALIELLIRLRAPQLSKKLDEKSLFDALSNALPSLATEVVDQVATAFRQLEDLRQQFKTLDDLQESLSQFRSGYQIYLRTLLVRRADDLASRHSQYERAHSTVTRLQESIDAGEVRKAEEEVRVIEARNHLTACEATLTGLQSRPEANAASELDRAGRNANDKKALFVQARERSSKAESQLVSRTQELDTQRSKAAEAQSERCQFADTASNTVVATGFAREHAECIPVSDAWPHSDKATREFQEIHRRKSADHLYRLDQIDNEQRKVAEAEAKLTATRSRQFEAEAKVESIRDQLNRHQTAALTALAGFGLTYRQWNTELRWIAMPPWSELEPSMMDWVETDAPDYRVLGGTLSVAARNEAESQAHVQAALQARRERIDHEIALLDHEAHALAIAPASPVLPKVRAASLESRGTRAGAALWRLCEFQPHLNLGQQAGIEAALEAAGLLDAWITPEGRVSLAGMPADTFLQMQTEACLSISGPTLADALCLDANADAVSAPVLKTILQQIGLGRENGRHWVSVDGEWQLGPLLGRGEKSVSEFIGTRSREAARERRLLEIAAQKDVLGNEIRLIETECDALETRRAESQAEHSSAPTDEEIARHLTLRTNARVLLNEATGHSDEAMRHTTAAQRKVDDQSAAFESLVRHLGYGEYLPHIGELRDAWSSYDRVMSNLWHKAQAWLTAMDHLARAEGVHRQAEESHVLESKALVLAETASIEATHSFEALRLGVGLSVQEYRANLDDARRAKGDAETSLRDATALLSSVKEQLAALQGQLPGAKEKVMEIETGREGSIRALRIIFDVGLFGEADESLAETDPQSWAPTRAVSIARTILKTWPELDHDDESWTRRLNVLDVRISELRNRNGNACPIESEQVAEGLTLITCVYQGKRLRPAECLLAVQQEREIHNRLLADEERKIIDRHLVTEVSLQLQQLIEQAQERTTSINKEMTRCATTLGVTMRLAWEPRTEDQPPALSAVLKLLLMDHAAWTDEQRQTVGVFLHQLIKDQRINNPAASAAEQLLNALDYRRWHAFTAERHQNGRWERLTRKRYGTGSGGEKALMLTIPQMAAAASHYSSTAPHAPRFILLDEAFAGMDKPTRSRCMGLLEAFNLDLVMTSEREHGAHPTISGIAIYQLVADADAVAATRWIWNGSRKLLAPVPDTPELRHP